MNFQLILASVSTVCAIITYLVFVYRNVNKDWWIWLSATGLFGFAAVATWPSVLIKW